MRALRTLAPLGIFLLGTSVSATAFADYFKQDGRVTASAIAEGSAVSIKGHAFHPRNGACYLFGNALTDGTTPRQVEVGLVRCKNATLTTTCHDLHTFAERFDGISYRCNQGSPFALDAAYNSIVSRNSGTTIGGTIAGTSISQSGFLTTDSVRAVGMGEATGTVNGCPIGDVLGYFTGWQKLGVGAGWSYVTNSAYIIHSGNIAVNCANPSAITSGGNFSVSN